MGLSLAEAWRTSPRTIHLVTKARNEVALDELEQRVHAAYAGEFFHRQKRLGLDSLKKILPKRKRGHGEPKALTMEQEIARQDAWANGINRRLARAEKMRHEMEARAAEKAAEKAAKRRRQGQG